MLELDIRMPDTRYTYSQYIDAQFYNTQYNGIQLHISLLQKRKNFI
jgi:hypothetical protein